MSGHALSIAKSVERVQDRVVAHGLLLVHGSREYQSSIACGQFERPQYFHGVTGQGNNMRRVHLHALGWNGPTCFIQIKLCPRRFDFLAGSHKRICHQLHGKTRDCVPVVIVHFRQEFRQFPSVHAGPILGPGFGQDVPGLEVRSRIPACDTTGDGISKNLSGILMGAFRNVSRVASLDGKHEHPTSAAVTESINLWPNAGKASASRRRMTVSAWRGDSFCGYGTNVFFWRLPSRTHD